MRFIHNIAEKIPQDFVTDFEIKHLLPGSSHSRYGVVKRALQKGDLIHLRRGLYCLGKQYRSHPLDLFLLAQKIYGPSYISLESALSFHGWIPEAVPTITSATSKRSRSFETPVGLFTYSTISCEPFFEGVSSENDKGQILMARPWKALADYIYLYKKDWDGIHPLMHSLRIEENELHQTTREELESLQVTFHSRRVGRFLKGVLKDLQL